MMKFAIRHNDSLLCHAREIYICRWDEELMATVQYFVAGGIFTTPWGAKSWVRTQLYELLAVNDCLIYYED